jgi:hypothetical protein
METETMVDVGHAVQAMFDRPSALTSVRAWTVEARALTDSGTRSQAPGLKGRVGSHAAFVQVLLNRDS